MSTKKSICLADGGKHRWKYLPTSGRRECQKCGALQDKQGNRWVQVGSSRWVPLMPSERVHNETTPASGNAR